MQAKSVLYAAVGAPVVAARKVSDKASAIKGKMDEQRAAYGESAEKAIDSWAMEGEKVVSKVSEGKVVEEISSKVDLDQAKEQVGKLRNQLEDMMSTWRHSFRPEKAEADEEAAPEVKAEEKTPAAETKTEKPAAKKPAAAKTSAAKTTKSSTAAKTSSTKSTSEKKAS